MRYTEHRLRAEDEITRLLFAYGSSIDSGRLDDMARLFEKGVWYLNDDLPFRGFEEVSNFLRENVLLYDGVPRTRHVITNVRIDLDDDGSSAGAESYVIVFQAVEGRAPEIIFQGAYNDRFSCSEGSWRFTERRIITDGTGDMSRHLKGAATPGSGSL